MTVIVIIFYLETYSKLQNMKAKKKAEGSFTEGAHAKLFSGGHSVTLVCLSFEIRSSTHLLCSSVTNGVTAIWHQCGAFPALLGGFVCCAHAGWHEYSVIHFVFERYAAFSVVSKLFCTSFVLSSSLEFLQAFIGCPEKTFVLYSFSACKPCLVGS